MVFLWALFVVPPTVSKQLMQLHVQNYTNKGGKAITVVPTLGSRVGVDLLALAHIDRCP